MLFAEIPVLAVRLHAENKDLFDDYDRALAEAAFRISIMPPIVLILFSIPFQPAVSAFWAVASVRADLLQHLPGPALGGRARHAVPCPPTASHRGGGYPTVRYGPSARLVSGECATIGVRGTRSHNNAEGIGK